MIVKNKEMSLEAFYKMPEIQRWLEAFEALEDLPFGDSRRNSPPKGFSWEILGVEEAGKDEAHNLRATFTIEGRKRSDAAKRLAKSRTRQEKGEVYYKNTLSFREPELEVDETLFLGQTLI